MPTVEAPPAGTTPQRTLKALLVGIDAYRDPVRALRGCVADVERVAVLLEGRAAATGDRLDLRLLRDDEATRDAVVDAFRSHLGSAGPDDTALFYYCGHGSRQLPGPAGAGLEPDALDETLVLVDSRDPGRFDLTDKELGQLVAEASDVAGHVLVVLDCCHSGSGVRDTGDVTGVRQAPADRRPRPADSYLTPRARSARGPGSGPGGPGGAAPGAGGDRPPVGPRLHRPAGTHAGTPEPTTGPGGRYVLLAACRSDQTAKEVTVDGARRGAFSTALENALALDGRPDYLGLQRSVAAAVRNVTTDQSPVLEAPVAQDVRLPFLGGVAAPVGPLLTASWVARTGWVLDAGRLHGIPAVDRGVPTTVVLHRLLGAGGTAAGGPADAPGIPARVVQVRAATSLLTPGGDRPLDRTATYRAVLTSAPRPETAVSVHGTGAVAEAVRERLRSSPLVRPAEAPADGADDADGDLTVHADADRITVTAPGAQGRVTAAEDTADDAGVDRVVAACEHVARWLGVSRRSNPGSELTEQVELRVRDRAGGLLPGSGDRLEVAYTGPGEEDSPVIAVSYTNGSSRPLHCAVLVLTELYGVECLTTGGSVLLAPGETAWVTDETERPQLRTTVPEGQDRTTDLLKLVVSGEAFDARSMSQAELEPATLTRAASAGTHRGVTRATALPTGDDWATREVLVTTVRPGRRSR